jgi:hypothetical protein
MLCFLLMLVFRFPSCMFLWMCGRSAPLLLHRRGQRVCGNKRAADAVLPLWTAVVAPTHHYRAISAVRFAEAQRSKRFGRVRHTGTLCHLPRCAARWCVVGIYDCVAAGICPHLGGAAFTREACRRSAVASRATACRYGEARSRDCGSSHRDRTTVDASCVVKTSASTSITRSFIRQRCATPSHHHIFASRSPTREAEEQPGAEGSSTAASDPPALTLRRQLNI